MEMTAGGAEFLRQAPHTLVTCVKRTTVMEKCARWIVVPLRSVRADQLRGYTKLRTGEQTDGVHSPDCEELDPNKRQVRRKPKQHRAVVGFIVVLGKYLL